MPQQKQILAEAFAGEGWEIPRLLEAMWTAPDIYFDRVARRRWTAGRAGGWRCWGTPRTVPRRCLGWARAWRWLARMCWLGSSQTAGDDYTAAFARYQRELARSGQAGAEVRQRRASDSCCQRRAHRWMTNQGHAHDGAFAAKALMSSGVEKAANAVTLKDYQAPVDRRPHLPAKHPGARNAPEKFCRHPERCRLTAIYQTPTATYNQLALQATRPRSMDVERTSRQPTPTQTVPFPGPRARADARADRPSAQCAHSVRHRAYHGLSGHRADQ